MGWPPLALWRHRWVVTSRSAFLQAQPSRWALALAHAKAGGALTVSGYLESTDTLDGAMGEFALAYAYQIERDHAAHQRGSARGEDSRPS